MRIMIMPNPNIDGTPLVLRIELTPDEASLVSRASSSGDPVRIEVPCRWEVNSTLGTPAPLDVS